MSNTPTNYHSLLRVLWQRRSIVIYSVLIAGAIAVALYFLLPPRYESRAKLLVVRKGPKPVSSSTLNQSTEFESNLAVHQSLITSDAIIRAAMDAQRLNSLPSMANEQKPVEHILKSLFVEREKSEDGPSDTNSSILLLSYRSSVAEDSPKILTALIESYQEFLNQLHRSDKGEMRQVYEKWKSDIQTEINSQQARYSKLKVAAAKLGVTERRSMTVPTVRLTEVEKERVAQSVLRATLDKRLKALKQARERGISPIALAELASRWMPAPTSRTYLQDQLLSLTTLEQDLLSRFGEQHPQVIELRKRVKKLQSLMAKAKLVTAKTLDPLALEESLRRELTVVTEVVEALDFLVKDARSELSRSVEYFEQAELLREQISQNRGLYREVIRQMQELDLVKNSKFYSAQIIVPPQLGLKVIPSAPVLAIILGALGLVCGGGLAFLVESMDRRVRNPQRLHDEGLHVLGQLPLFTKRTRVAVETGHPDGQVCVFHHPNGDAAKSFSLLRTTLLCGTGNSKVIEITSPSNHEGKTTLTANLATAIAQAGRSVLVVDLNLRDGRLHQLFHLGNETGMASYLAGEDPLEAQRTHIEGLSVVSCGPTTSQPDELLLSDRFKTILRKWKTQYDYVLLDAASMLSTDPSVIAPQVDGILVVTKTSAKLSEATRCVQLLEGLQANVLGIVINFAPVKDLRQCGPVSQSNHHTRRNESPNGSANGRSANGNGNGNGHPASDDYANEEYDQTRIS